MSKKSKKDGLLAEMDVSMFYFKWSNTLLDSYTKVIKTNYLKVLICHCTKARMTNNEGGNLAFDYSELGSDPRVIKDDREDIKRRLKQGKKLMEKGEDVDQCTMITLVELSSLYRLKMLVKTCEKLIGIITKMVTWMEDKKTLLRTNVNFSVIFPFVRKVFEAVCAIGEVFRLISVNWASEKYAKALKPSSDDYKSSKESVLEPKEAKLYCPQLMCQINYFRTLVYTIGCSFSGILETISVRIPCEDCGIQPKEISEILKKLPPQYLYAHDLLRLSKRTVLLIEHSPRNERSFPLMSININPTSKSSHRKSAHAQSRKYQQSGRDKSKSKSEKKASSKFKKMPAKSPKSGERS